MNEYIYKTVSEYTKNKSLDLKSLAGDASHREYFIEKNSNLIVCDYHDDEEGFHDFIAIQKLFSKNNVPVPKIQFSSFPVLILENLGKKDLYSNFQEHLYFKSIESLAKIQNLKTDFAFKTKEPSFTVDKFVWELNFAQEHLTKHLKIKSSSSLESEFAALSNFLIHENKQTPTHRDFHSKNIMVTKDHEISIIDFQDARTGPYLYDLSSLVDDPYVPLEPHFKSRLINNYCELSSTVFNSQFEKDFRLTSIQRIFKACGSFASQKNLKNKDSYLKYLTPSFQILLKNLEIERQNFPKMRTFIENCSKIQVELNHYEYK